MERRWKNNVVSQVSSVIVVLRLPISCVSSMAISCHVPAVSLLWWRFRWSDLSKTPFVFLHRLSLSSQIIVYYSIFIYLFSVDSCTAPWTLRKTVHTRVITFARYREMEIIVMSVSVVLPVYLRSYFRNHKSEFIASFLRMLLVTVVRSSFGNRPIHCESKKTRRYTPIRYFAKC